MSAPRLSAAARPDLVPSYERERPPTIVHLGVGAFARAHLGVYADDLLRAGWPALIHGVSLRSRAAEDQLAAQDGLYSLQEREPGTDPSPRVLGAFTAVSIGPDAAAAAIADPATRLVTLTVTEKGYAPEEVPAVVARGLARRDRAAPVPVIASLDNLADNGDLLRARVLEVADGDVARWIADAVPFPSSVVDRMVPATTAADLDEVEARLGSRDEAAVVAEHHRSWVLEAAAGLPPVGEVGVQVVSDLGPYQQRKLWLLNGPHSAVAYAGLLAGCDTIADAVDEPVVAAFVQRVVADVLEVAEVPDKEAFADEAVRRFANPALGHTCRQVGADGSQKLPQRILPVVVARREQGRPTRRLALVVAAWVRAVRNGTVEDPAAPADPLAIVGDRAFAAEVAGTLEDLMRRGVDVLGESA